MKYINVSEIEGIMYGVPFWNNNKNFNKYPAYIREEIKETRNESVLRDWDSLSGNVSGCFLHFRTDAFTVAIRAELKREWEYAKISLCNSSGFDIYEYNGKEYYHKTTIVPFSGDKKVIGFFDHNPETEICIFLPLYNEIISLEIGTESGNIISTKTIQGLPILFYGNSITQGASASRSGNSFCNIIARKLNREIYNYSVSGCCNALCSIAQIIGSLEVDAIVIDYSRNASNITELKLSYERFYRELRKYHKNTLVILMTVANFKNHIKYAGFDEIIYKTYEKAVAQGHNIALLDQKEIFLEDEYDLISIDGAHYTDMGMLRIADEICSILAECWGNKDGKEVRNFN